MIKLNHPYRCRHCGKSYVIIKGHGFNSYLPVELINNDEMNDLEFDKNKHKSHLLNCPKLQAQWESVKQMIAEQERKKEKIFMEGWLR